MHVHVRYHSYAPLFLLLCTRQQHIHTTRIIATTTINIKAPPTAATMGMYTGNIVGAEVVPEMMN